MSSPHPGIKSPAARISFLKISRLCALASVFLILGSGCFKKAERQNFTQAAPSAPLSAPAPQNQNVRTPLPPQQIQPLTPPNNYEEAKLEAVMPGSSSTFDPFTFGRQGSPYGPGKLFQPGQGTQRCGPLTMPMSPQFADPGDTQAVLIILGNGASCLADIDHDKAGAAITFSAVAALFTNSPWVITSSTTTQVTITNGTVTLRITFSIQPPTTFITKVEYL